MRVLHLINALAYGGIRRHVLDLVQGLADHGVDCRIAAWLPEESDLQGRNDTTNLPLYRSGRQDKSAPGAVRSLQIVRTLLDSERIDVLHMHSRYATLLGALAARRRHVARIYTVHSDFRNLRFLPFYPSHVICPSEAIRESWRRHSAFRTDANISIISHGIEQRALRVVEKVDGSLFCFVGRFDSFKRADLVLEALATLRAGGVPLRVRLVGSGPEEASLRIHVARLALENAVEFRGYVRDVYAELQDALALVFPSDALDSVGYVNLEASSIGVPVIASRLPQLGEYVRHGQTGLLFKPGDALSLAAAMRYAYEHPEEMAGIGRAAYKQVRERNSIQDMVGATLNVYRQALQSESPCRQQE
jgi:glycosyltransferase involved in cell wall biosynthesis